jgi:FkbM family methyltransferase
VGRNVRETNVISVTSSWWHHSVLGLKAVVYGRRGEPYEVDGRTLRYLPGSRPIRPRYLHSSNRVNRFDALQVEWLRTQLKEGDLAIDVGGHHGMYSVLMSAKCGKTGQVVAFEPDPYARTVLARNVDLNPGIKHPVVESYACSDTVGEMTLFCGRGNALSSLARSAVESSLPEKPEEIRVPVVTLDSYLAGHNLSEPRCVKVDAEGAEIRVLKGATKVLAGNACVLCELHPYAWPEFGSTFAELKDLAAAHGRHIRYLDENAEIGGSPIYGVVILER